MKYAKNMFVTNEQLSIQETLVEISDCVMIAKETANNLSENFSGDTKKELDLILTHLKEIEIYLPILHRKVNDVLPFVPKNIQEEKYL